MLDGAPPPAPSLAAMRALTGEVAVAAEAAGH
jgi:hypothetical protein